MNRRIVFVIAIVAIVVALGSVLIFSGVINSNPAESKCIVAGCSGELCIDKTDNNVSGVSMCIWTNQYACYKTAKCELQSTGKCGWTVTSELNACIANAQ